MSDLLCERCGDPALVIYEQKPLCGPCAVAGFDDKRHHLVVHVDDRNTLEDEESVRNTTSSSPS